VCYCRGLLIIKLYILSSYSVLPKPPTCNGPRQHPFPSPCTVHNSTVSTFLPRICLLHCHAECVIVNVNFAFSPQIQKCVTCCVSYQTQSYIILLQFALPLTQFSMPYVAAYVDLIFKYCTYYVTKLLLQVSVLKANDTSVEIVHSLCGTHRSTAVSTGLLSFSILVLSQMNSVHIIQSCFFNIHFNISSSIS
jgi:hypothetical protein